jgi:hypothetical protein
MGASSGVPFICLIGMGASGTGSLDWVDPTGSGVEVELGGGEHALPDFSLGTDKKSCQHCLIFGC